MKNPQAFPLQTKIASGLGGVLDEEGSLEMGMTLLDYFAGQALAGEDWQSNLILDEKYGVIAYRCYSIAEAMLKEREKRSESKWLLNNT